MALVRWSPWREMNTLQRQMSHLFDEALIPSTDWQKGFPRVPAAEMEETKDAIHLKLEVPGVEAKDLEVQVTENTVSISGERKSETKTEDKGLTRSEFHYGKFQRVVSLPARIQNNSVQAEYKDGVLNLTLPKTEAEKNKVVRVNLGQSAA